jgi:hypothetical protein
VRELGMQAFLKIKLHREVEPAGLETQEEQQDGRDSPPASMRVSWMSETPEMEQAQHPLHSFPAHERSARQQNLAFTPAASLTR